MLTLVRAFRLGSSGSTVALVLACLAASPMPAHALKVATWNLINYPTSNLAARQPNIRTVVAALDPDVILVQELLSDAGRESLLTNVLNVVHPGQWSATAYFVDTQSAIFYKTSKVIVTFPGQIEVGGPRQVLRALLKLPGYVSNAAQFRVHSVHFKASLDLPSDSMTRRVECTNLRRDFLNTLPAGSNFLIAGDMNFYGSWEGGYIRLTENQLDNDGRSFDPLSMPGTWNSSGYSPYHTQSTCTSCPGGWPGGGLDDRFDLILPSASMSDNEGLSFVGGPLAYGNDGNHFNQAVNAGTNGVVSAAVANALANSSDHLPVMVVVQAPAKVAASSQVDFGRVIVGATDQRPLSVGNGAAVPADELTYSFTAPSGFIAPGGSQAANAGAGANVHLIAMDASTVGAKAGTLTITTDDPDSASKSVLLSGLVIAHAEPSLDSLAIVRSDTLDFGLHGSGQFADQNVCVYNTGWSSLQATLALTNGFIAGGASRFSIVGDFGSADLTDAPACYAIHFNDAGATIDSTYEATLTFLSEDEPISGGVPRPNLVVRLRAELSSGPLDVGEGAPARIAFHPPAPNPFRNALTLRFDLPREADVALELFDLSGRRVAQVIEGTRPAGRHELRWTASDPAGPPIGAGIYFVRFRSGSFVSMRRVVLLP